MQPLHSAAMCIWIVMQANNKPYHSKFLRTFFTDIIIHVRDFANDMNIFNNSSMISLVWCYVHWWFYVHKTNERSMPHYEYIGRTCVSIPYPWQIFHRSTLNYMRRSAWVSNVAIDGLVSNHDCSISTIAINVNKIFQWLGPNL